MPSLNVALQRLDSLCSNLDGQIEGIKVEKDANDCRKIIKGIWIDMTDAAIELQKCLKGAAFDTLVVNLLNKTKAKTELECVAERVGQCLQSLKAKEGVLEGLLGSSMPATGLGFEELRLMEKNLEMLRIVLDESIQEIDKGKKIDHPTELRQPIDRSRPTLATAARSGWDFLKTITGWKLVVNTVSQVLWFLDRIGLDVIWKGGKNGVGHFLGAVVIGGICGAVGLVFGAVASVVMTLRDIGKSFLGMFRPSIWMRETRNEDGQWSGKLETKYNEGGDWLNGWWKKVAAFTNGTLQLLGIGVEDVQPSADMEEGEN